MQSGITQQGSQPQTQEPRSQSLAESATGLATCTVAFGSIRLHCTSQVSQESSLENILTLPSLPNRMTFLLKTANAVDALTADD